VCRLIERKAVPVQCRKLRASQEQFIAVTEGKQNIAVLLLRRGEQLIKVVYPIDIKLDFITLVGLEVGDQIAPSAAAEQECVRTVPACEGVVLCAACQEIE
jgi:hypothetical protein